MRSEAASAPLTRYLAVETAIGTMVNTVIAGVFTMLMFGSGEIAFWGLGGLAFDFIPSTFLPVFAMTVGMTWATRKRRRDGKAPTIDAPPLALSSNPFVRAALFGVAATLVLGAIGMAILLSFWSPAVPFAALLMFKIGYGALVGLLATPLIVIAALRDRLPR